MTTVPVLIENWQHECCGDPFRLGDRVTWQLCYLDDLRELFGPAERVTLSLGVQAVPDSDGAHLSSGELHVFWPSPSTREGLVDITGVFAEERHDDHTVPGTTGVVRRIRHVTMRHRQDFGTNVWRREPGTEAFTELWESDPAPDAPAEAEAARWGIGLLVDLEVSLR